MLEFLFANTLLKLPVAALLESPSHDSLTWKQSGQEKNTKMTRKINVQIWGGLTEEWSRPVQCAQKIVKVKYNQFEGNVTASKTESTYR